MTNESIPTGVKRGMSTGQKWALGCLIAFGLFVLTIVVSAYLIYVNARSIGANIAHAQLVTVVKNSALPEDQKVRIISRLDRVNEDFKAGKITMDDIGRVLTEMTQSPLIALGAVNLAQEKYIKPSDMTKDEQAQAILSLQRLARGVYEKKIKQSDLQDVMALISTKTPDGQTQLKEKLTRAELDAFIAAAKQKADAAAIPNEPFVVDVATELDKAIDKALKGGPAGASQPAIEAPGGAAPETQPGG